jgi:hypothetical protein
MLLTVDLVVEAHTSPRTAPVRLESRRSRPCNRLNLSERRERRREARKAGKKAPMGAAFDTVPSLSLWYGESESEREFVVLGPPLPLKGSEDPSHSSASLVFRSAHARVESQQSDASGGSSTGDMCLQGEAYPQCSSQAARESRRWEDPVLSAGRCSSAAFSPSSFSDESLSRARVGPGQKPSLQMQAGKTSLTSRGSRTVTIAGKK